MCDKILTKKPLSIKTWGSKILVLCYYLYKTSAETLFTIYDLKVLKLEEGKYIFQGEGEFLC